MFSLQLFIIMFDFNNFILCCDLFEYDILIITYKVFVSRKMFSLLVLGVVLNYVTLFFLYDFNAQNYISPAHTFFFTIPPPSRNKNKTVYKQPIFA